MSLFNTLSTAVSGMAAQANWLGTIGDNIANSGTTGYKEASTQFETVLGNQTAGSYASGGVQTRVRYGVTTQGTLANTSSVTDLAVNGNGFFLVQASNGSTALTRAGSFVPNGAGNLVNAAGYELMGYNLTDGSSATANGIGGLQVVNMSSQALTANPSKSGVLSFNVPSTDTAVAAANLPSTNAAGATYSQKTSLIAYDNLGTATTYDIYLTKTGTGTWEAAAYNKADAAPGGGFPYSTAAVSTATLAFDATTGKLAAGSPKTLSIPVANGATVSLDISQSTQLATDFTINTATVDGGAPSKLDHFTIGNDGTVTSVYANGVTQATYRIPLADVPSPDNLIALSSNVYEPGPESGGLTIGTAKSGSLGAIDSASLEQSTVDLATELTNMISAQRSYEANSKVIQTTSDLLGVINNLKG